MCGESTVQNEFIITFMTLLFCLQGTKYAVKDVFEGAAYEFRVSAINLSGAGDPSFPCDTVIARDPMSKPVCCSI